MGSLKNKNIVITGANRGIGLAFAEACAQKGNYLYLINRSEDLILSENLKKKGALSVTTLICDLTNKEEINRTIEKLKNIDIDVLFNNAGLLTGGLLEEQSFIEIENMLKVNVNSLIQFTHATLPQMLKRKTGKIINHSSVSAIMHFPCATTYAASKAAVWAFTNCLQQELKGTGVSTLCLITPGIKTRMFDQIDEKYSKNLETPKDSISPQKYAKQIINAIENNQTTLEPKGLTAIGLSTAKHFSGIFNWAVQTKFNR